MLSIYVRNKIIDKVLNGMDFVVPNIYVSLHSDNPVLTGSNELTGGFYTRQVALFKLAEQGIAENGQLIKFEGMPAVTVKYAGLWDSPVQGNFLLGTALENAVRLNNGTNFIFAAGKLKVRMD